MSKRIVEVVALTNPSTNSGQGYTVLGTLMQQAKPLLACAGSQALPTEAARAVVLQAAQAFFDSASSLEAEEIGLGQVTLGLLPHDPEAGQLGACLQALQELQDYGLHLLPVDYNQVCSCCLVMLYTCFQPVS